MPGTISIELKSVKTMPSLSKDSNAYTAKLYVDGEFIAVVGNEGNGGCDRVYDKGRKGSLGDAMRAYDAACLRYLREAAPVNTSEEGEPPVMENESLEDACGGIIERGMIVKEIARLTRKSIVLFTDGLPKPGEHAPLSAYRLENPAHLEAAKASILAKHPGGLILNGLPEDEAVKAYGRSC